MFITIPGIFPFLNIERHSFWLGSSLGITFIILNRKNIEKASTNDLREFINKTMPKEGQSAKYMR